MAVTAKFFPDQLELAPNTPATLTLRLYNDDARARDVTLAAAGALTEHVRFDVATATLETNKIVDVFVTVLAPATVEAGTYTIAADVGLVAHAVESQPLESAATQSGVVVATATVELPTHSDYTIALQPTQSRGSQRGRHSVRVANTGNVAIAVAVHVEASDSELIIELDQPLLTVAPGDVSELAVRVVPPHSYWTGPTTDHAFTLCATSTDGRTNELTGTYQQRPRVPNWVGPAAAGAGAALVVGVIIWLGLLRPWVTDTADSAAVDAIEQDRAALQNRIDELETAAREAEELPLGSPTDIRLDVAPAADSSEQAVANAESGTILSITDIVFENPTGAVGVVSLLRNDEILLRSELANFRDLDRHFVAPFQFDDNDTIVLEVECRTPGAGESACLVGALLVGFVDETN
jgi:hypothetical protein